MFGFSATFNSNVAFDFSKPVGFNYYCRRSACNLTVCCQHCLQCLLRLQQPTALAIATLADVVTCCTESLAPTTMLKPCSQRYQFRQLTPYQNLYDNQHSSSRLHHRQPSRSLRRHYCMKVNCPGVATTSASIAFPSSPNFCATSAYNFVKRRLAAITQIRAS